MPIQSDVECREMIEKLNQGLPPQIIHEIITYLEKTKNSAKIQKLLLKISKSIIENLNVCSTFL